MKSLDMYSIAILLVVLSGLIHSIWNLFTKKSINKVVFLWFCQCAAILIFLPLTFHEMMVNVIDLGNGWVLILLSMLLHGVYLLLLAKTYSIGDLSQAYPVMRGISPILVPLIGVLVFELNLSTRQRRMPFL
jgi:drug/metabolite transporter (DMT)-like permease